MGEKTMEIKGIKKAVGNYHRFNNKEWNTHGYLMIDRETGEVWTDEIIGGGWINYSDKSIINLLRWAAENGANVESVNMSNVKKWAETACEEWQKDKIAE